MNSGKLGNSSYRCEMYIHGQGGCLTNKLWSNLPNPANKLLKNPASAPRMLQDPGVCHQLSQAAALVRRLDQCSADVVNQPRTHELGEAWGALPDGADGLITRRLQDG
jgi:hypothetical protein